MDYAAKTGSSTSVSRAPLKIPQQYQNDTKLTDALTRTGLTSK